MEITFSQHLLEFKHPFKIALNSRTSTPVVITVVECQGFNGYGEASLPPYLEENTKTVFQFLAKAEKVLHDFDRPDDLESILKRIAEIAEGNTAAKASVDIALHDLKGKLEGRPCHTFWNQDKKNNSALSISTIGNAIITPDTSFTIGMDEPAVILEKLKEAEDFNILKVKLGGSTDFDLIEQIRSYTNKTISVDVNQGWKTKEDALERIEWLKDKNVLFIEQPLNKLDLSGAAWLKERSPLPIIADESFQRFSDLEYVKDCFHGINIKLMKCSGLNEAFKIIVRARKLNLKILIGCMAESSCAVSAAGQLSPLADWSDLDGPLLIKNDLFSGLNYANGKLILNDKPGIGVERIRY
jgi:L-alanine-DL-glutamate epimerase-like enolase superfamily enzyme